MAVKTINDLDLTPPDNFDDLQTWLARNFAILHSIIGAGLIPIWAEENAPLATATFEWAFGNGADTLSGFGVVVHVPTGFQCEVVAMSLSIGAGTATVEINLNGVNQGSAADVTVSAGTSVVNKLTTPLAIVDGDVLNFRTTTAAGGLASNQVCAWLRMFPTAII